MRTIYAFIIAPIIPVILFIFLSVIVCLVWIFFAGIYIFDVDQMFGGIGGFLMFATYGGLIISYWSTILIAVPLYFVMRVFVVIGRRVSILSAAAIGASMWLINIAVWFDELSDFIIFGLLGIVVFGLIGAPAGWVFWRICQGRPMKI